MAIKRKKKKAAKAAKKAKPPVPRFLTTRQFKKLAEATRRQRISVARKGGAIPAAAPEIDLSVGFDPGEDI